MARHRNVRTMNYDDEYEGYDDVYGHSVEDDYPASPSVSQYFYDRSKSTQMSQFFTPENNISEEPEDEGDVQKSSSKDIERTRQRLDSLTIDSAVAEAVADLVPEEEILLKSCVDEIHNAVGDNFPDNAIIAHILHAKFDGTKALDNLLNGVQIDRSTLFHAPKKLKSQSPAPKQQPMKLKDPPVKAKAESTPTKPVKSTVAPAASTAKSTSSASSSSTSSGPLKVVPASSGKSVTVGFDIPKSKEKERSTTPVSGGEGLQPPQSTIRCPSPVSTTPKQSKTKEFKPEVALTEYSKERGSSKDLLNLLVIGHVDAGKSTLMGHLLYQLGQVPKKAMHKFEQESKKLGKQSFMYAWVLDETGEERSRGITMDIAQSKFETDNKTINLLDAPGHKDFIPNMITGASQADVAVLVVDATKGEFETGFESGGQTREHALLVRSLGVTQLVVAVNKLDTVSWSKDRFDEIKAKLASFLIRNAGFREADLSFVPCSGLQGENLTKPSAEAELTSWYKGPTLIKAIDSLKPPERPVGKPLRISVSDVFKGPGGMCIGGRIETGMVQAGDKVLIQPVGEIVVVKNITLEDGMGTTAFAGDPVIIALQGVSDGNVLAAGCLLSDPNYPCRVSSRIQARIVTFDAMTVPLTKGFTGVLHLGSLQEQVTVKKLISQLAKGTGEVVKTKPRCLVKNSNALIELETSRPACVEEFKDVKELGRFTLRYAGVTIAAGVITKVM